MTVLDQPTIEDLRNLSEMTSTCYRASNRAWLALMAVATLVLIPRSSTEVGLPFDLGVVPITAFNAIALTLLVATTVAFAAAHAQTFLGQKLARRVIEGFPDTASLPRLGLHPRDVFDALQQPTINRVGPLAHLLRARYQLMPEAAIAPRWVRGVSTAYYVVLKAVAGVFYFIVPAFALWRAFAAVEFSGPSRWLAWAGVLIAGAVFLEVICMEVAHVYHVASKSLGARPRSDAA